MDIISLEQRYVIKAKQSPVRTIYDETVTDVPYPVRDVIEYEYCIYYEETVLGHPPIIKVSDLIHREYGFSSKEDAESRAREFIMDIHKNGGIE